MYACLRERWRKISNGRKRCSCKNKILTVKLSLLHNFTLLCGYTDSYKSAAYLKLLQL